MATGTFRRFILVRHSPSKKLKAASISYSQQQRWAENSAVITERYEEFAIINIAKAHSCNSQLSQVFKGTNTKVGEKKLRTPVSASVVTT